MPPEGAPAAAPILSNDDGGAPAPVVTDVSPPPLADPGPAPTAAPVVAAPADTSWKDTLPDDLKADPSLGAIHDINSLAKSYVNAQKLVGKEKFVIPGEHATSDDWRGVYRKLGLPETIETYEMKIPEGSNFEDGFVSALKKTAFEQNILPHQISGLLEWYSEANNEQSSKLEERHVADREAEIANLKTEWGEAYQQNVNLAKQALRVSGMGDALFTWLDDSGLDTDPMMVKLMSALGGMLGEDHITSDKQQQGLSPDDLDTQIKQIMGDKEHPFNVKEHPNHNQAVQDVMRLRDRQFAKQQA